MLKARFLVAVLAGLALLATADLFTSHPTTAMDKRSYALTPTAGEIEGCSDYFSESDDCGDLSAQDIRSELRIHGKTLGVVVADYAKLGRFESLIQASGLSNKISSGGPFTIFAPTNDAVLAANLNSFLAASKTVKKEQLRRLVASHIVAGEISWKQLAGRRSVLISLTGSRIVIEGDQGLRIGKAAITDSDVLAANGIVHIVDAVITDTNENAPRIQQPPQGS